MSSAEAIDPVGSLGGERPEVTGWRSALVQRPILLVWFGTVMFSTGPVMVASSSVSGAVFSFWRLWIGVVLLGTLALGAQRRSSTTITRDGFRWTLVAGVTFAIHQVCLMAALHTTSVVDVTLMNTLAPLVVALLAVKMFDERPGSAFRAWSVVAIAGAVVVAVAGSSGPGGHPLGMALAAVNVVFYSFFFVASKRARDHIDIMTFLAMATAVAAMVVSFYVGMTGAIEGTGWSTFTISAHDLLLCLAVAAIPGLLGHFSMTWSLKFVPANLPPVIMLSLPFLSGALAWVLLGQTITWVKVAGGALTLAGVAGAIRSASGASVTVEAIELAEET
jgi:drug/metabolite transporter (DMT)-like permease